MALYCNDIMSGRARDHVHNADENARMEGSPADIMRTFYGNGVGMSVNVREPGHHAQPHAHEFEQMNYIMSGEMWWYVENEAYYVKTGDMFRIPSNAIHWAWVVGDVPCIAVQGLTPPPGIKDRAFADTAVGLFGVDEERTVVACAPVWYVDPYFHGLDIEKIESQHAINRPEVTPPRPRHDEAQLGFVPQ